MKSLNICRCGAEGIYPSSKSKDEKVCKMCYEICDLPFMLKEMPNKKAVENLGKSLLSNEYSVALVINGYFSGYINDN